jgi:hypothetical protein
MSNVSRIRSLSSQPTSRQLHSGPSQADVKVNAPELYRDHAKAARVGRPLAEKRLVALGVCRPSERVTTAFPRSDGRRFRKEPWTLWLQALQKFLRYSMYSCRRQFECPEMIPHSSVSTLYILSVQH